MAKRVLLGVTGCIAAYKACEILRELQRRGCDVEVVMTESATRFVSPYTFSALSGRPALVDNFQSEEDAIPHIRAAEDCDVYLIAPCTANVIGKVAGGIADDLVTTCALVAHERLCMAPAMNVHMYEAPSVQDNLETLRKRGASILEPSSGYLACGDVGKGRLPEPDVVASFALEACSSVQSGSRPLYGLSVLVTAGPTVEWIDPVRFISNPSSGKMGYAIAETARDMGADVTLVSGPVSLSAPDGIRLVRVGTAQEMMDACEQAFPESNIAVFSAAVSDFRPASTSERKLKKPADSDALSRIDMVECPDVLATLAARKTAGQYVIGFAAETEDVLSNAKLKLGSKHADMIVANDVSKGKAFGSDEEAVSLVTSEEVQELPVLPKREVARRILEAACDNFKVC